MIPVLILPVYNGFDLFRRMLDTIDVPVKQALVVDNSPDGLPAIDYPFTTHVLRGLSSFGYGGSINVGIMQAPLAPWWMWVSNDVFFHPGQLAEVVEIMSNATEPTVVTGGFTWGALNAAVVERVGLIDEWSFWPIYYDDNDYHRRCVLADVQWIERHGFTHGDGAGSHTIREDDHAAHANSVTFIDNRDRYRAKWGGDPGHERFVTPWDAPHELSYLRHSFTGRVQAAKAWHRTKVSK